ncbi:MAG: hypothetical protein ACI4UN_03020 [Muribaculaceae bacterium]
MKKEKRIAEGTAVDEFRQMKVGEVVLFPIERYGYAYIRSIPSGVLVKETCGGCKWRTRLDRINKTIEVTRVS